MIKAYFDGACEPNEDGGTMCYGAIIYHHDKKIHEISHLYKSGDNIASNNIAEYCGCISVLRYLISREFINHEVYIFGDSKMVIEQMRGAWGANQGKYIRYYEIATLLIANRFERVPDFQWIPKERNIEADRLSRRFL